MSSGVELQPPSVVVDMEAGGDEPSIIKRKGMNITFMVDGKVAFVWGPFWDVTYQVPNRANKKEKLSLLKNVSGFFKPGELSALMGPSGSGKTTLLDLLAGRKTYGDISGSIQYAGRQASKYFLRRYTGYVEQFDTLLSMLTVKEMLMYTADLKRSVKETRAQKEAVVDGWINKLALDTCKDTRIGSNLQRGISGGQSKRVNIGIALVSDPRVLFLDEPTSGLDSFTSNEVMTYVQRLTELGVTVCATIHSPSAYCFSLFNRMIMLVRGEVVYFGLNNDAAIDFFHSFNPNTQLISSKDGGNHAEWLTDVIVSTDREGRGPELADFFAKSELKAIGDRELGQMAKQASNIDETTMQELSSKTGTAVPTLYGLRTLFLFRTLKNYRDPEYLGPRMGDKILTTFIIFTLYWGIGDDYLYPDDPKAPLELPYSILSMLFMWSTLPAFGAAAYVPTITLEKATYVRERNDGLYRPITYLLYKIMEEFILAFCLSIVLAVAVWFTVDLAGNFAAFWLIYVLTLNIGIVLAYFVASVTNTIDVANAALPAYVVTLLFFAGLLIRVEEMPEYWEWYSYINFVRFSWMGLVVNQFDEQYPAEDKANDDWTRGEQTAELVYRLYEPDIFSQWGHLGILCCFWLFFFIAAWVPLQYRSFVTR